MDELLRRKLLGSSIHPYVEVSATVTSQTQSETFPIYNLVEENDQKV